jgi:hypothetical protein
MTAKLKPCPIPWCASIAKVDHYRNSDQTYFCQCQTCGTFTSSYITEAEAIEAWNTRPFEEKAVEVLAEQIQKGFIMAISLGYLCSKDLSVEAMRAEAKQLLGVKDE